MKKLTLICVLIILLSGCSNDENNYVNVKGRVEREINGQGISNQKVYLETIQVHGTGYWSYTTKIDSKEVVTDSNGNFNTSMKTDSNTFVSVFKSQDDNYTAFELTNFNLNQDLILKVQKFLKFKIFVTNSNPFDSNDYIYIDFASGFYQSFRTKIENFGIENTHYPSDITPGGGGTPAYDDTSWKGINVNSIVYYNVPENADTHKIYWIKRKNAIETNGVSQEIPFQENQLNEFHFDY